MNRRHHLVTVTRSDLDREAGRPEGLALRRLAPAEAVMGAACALACLRIMVDVVERRPSLWERFDAKPWRFLSALTVEVSRVYAGPVMWCTADGQIRGERPGVHGGQQGGAGWLRSPAINRT